MRTAAPAQTGARAARRGPTLGLALVLATALALVLPLGLATSTAAAPSGGRAPLAAAPDPTARAAGSTLVAARSALAGNGKDATLALRDVFLARRAMAPADRASADRLLARPAAGKRACAAVCVHWSTSGRHKATNAWAKKVLSTVSAVHRAYTAAGYRAPKPDGRVGGNAKTDIYVQNLEAGLYGYCTSDQRTQAYDVWAYCVVDNDYRGFPVNTPLQNLQVTAAHEYFHAVQFGYDAAEDTWLLEGTAAWVEDEVFDNVDDNRQYLSSSPMSHPGRPMDQAGETYHYGAWLFFRYLSEAFPARAGTLPTVVRDIWRRADARKGAPDDHSTKAIAAVLAARGTSLPSTFVQFAGANRRPAEVYAEGSAYEGSPLARTEQLSAGSASTWAVELDHLTSTTLALRPDATTSTLTLAFDLPDGGATQGLVTVRPVSGPAEVYLADTDGTGTISFTADEVASVEVTIANADVSYTCWKGTDFACAGTPLGDDQAATVQISAG